MVYRCILSEWAKSKYPNRPSVLEGEFTSVEIDKLNSEFYNIFFFPNSPSEYAPGTHIDGSVIDTFQFVFVDMDLKDGAYASKEAFVSTLDIPPTNVIDSGNGVHVYWAVSDLDAMSFLKLQRRLTRKYNTDEAVSKICQLMRVPDTLNTKQEGKPKQCKTLKSSTASYTCEDLDKLLPPLTHADESYCTHHYNSVYRVVDKDLKIDDQVPQKFLQMVRTHLEVKELWAGETDDRSKNDWRLGHLMFANGFSKDEARSVLVNTAKALSRAPIHRISYAEHIIEKIWTYELSEDKGALNLSSTVREIIERGLEALSGTRFYCWKYLDNTARGFRLGQVLGLVAGSGVGKTAVALNMFMGFVELNPDYDHFFIPLEQPENEIAERWKTMCGNNTRLYDKVHVISNYNSDGSFRHLSFDEIKDYILKFQETTKKKIGCVVIDHIGALRKKGKDGENQDIMDICHSMKAFALSTNTLLVMQSQSSREKAGIGDLELNKDAAYGTVYFESYCDYLITLWQPLKRCAGEKDCPSVTAFKFCKIRHKKAHEDVIKEDVPYTVLFDPKTECLTEMTQLDEDRFKYFNNKATNKRKLDRKTDLVSYTSVKETIQSGEADSNTNSGGIRTAQGVHKG